MNAQLRPTESPRLGIFTDEPAEAYYVRRLDVASNSGLTVLDNEENGCPARYFHWVHNPDDEEESAALAFGKAYHMATLEPERFRDVYAVMPSDAPRDLRYLRNAGKPSDTTKAAIAWWDDFEANNAGRLMLTRKDYDLAVAMAQSLRRLPMEFNGGKVRITLAELIDVCETEVSVYWIDEDTGILCKLRADLWSRELRFAGDLKGIRSASRSAFGRAIHAHRYHVAHAHYSEGFRVAGEPLASFGLLPVEKTAPYVAASWHVDPPSEERGWALRQRAMRRLQTCLQSGQWPGYTTTMTPIGIPAFGHYDLEDKAA